MVGWNPLEEKLTACEPPNNQCGHGEQFLILDANPEPGRYCVLCGYQRLRQKTIDLVDTVLACLRAAGGSDDLDELEAQCNAAGPRPSFLIRENVARLAEEREAYRYLAVSYAKLHRVSESSVDQLVAARIAQRKRGTTT